MPALIKHIDKIAREKQRDVLFVRFDPIILESFNYKEWPERNELIAWLEQENVPFEPCMGFASDSGFTSYLGQIYLDIPYDLDNSTYQKVSERLETADGHAKIEGVMFYLLKLEQAMENEHHDDPNFEFLID